MKGSRFFARAVDVRGDAFENHNVVLLDDIDNVAFDICQAFLDQGRADMLAGQGGESEFCEFVCVDAGACSNAYDPIDQIDSGNRDDTLSGFAKCRV